MLDRLRQAYADPDGEVARALAAGRKPIRTLGFDAPRALLIAAGFRPVRLVAPSLAATPRADAIMGQAEIGQRGRRLLEALIAPRDPEVPVVITQADAEQPQIFAALRELGRLGEPVPRHVNFLDLLHMERPASQAYNERRLAQLQDWLETVGGVRPDAGALAEADALVRRQCELGETLNRLRREAKIAGADALQAIGAAAILPAEEHVAALDALIASLEAAKPLSGRRVIVAGTPHESAAVYASVEAAGAVIVGETQAWGAPFLAGGAKPPRIESPAAASAAVAALATATDADVLHLAIGGDEAAPWDVATIKAALPDSIRFATLRCPAEPDEAFTAKVAAWLSGREEQTETPAATALQPARPSAPKPRPASTGRSRKSLASVADFNAYQREWFADVRKRVAEGAPFAVVNANAPQEILRALDIPFVVNQWWASIVAAKQQSRRYLGLLRAHDYPTDVEAYSAQGLAAAFDDDAELAPWGGLPRPNFVHAVASSEPTAKLFEHWARETGAACHVYERTIDPRPDLYSNWWERLLFDWDDALEPERIDQMVAELREVIAKLEAATGRSFSPERFAAIMDLVNEQEDYYRRTRDLVARTVPAPIGIVDSMPATMVPQWHRGTEWARDAARAFYEEVKSRVDQGLAAVPNERIRLMWVGRGLWSEMGFYQKWEESHGAVFVWSMYLGLAADGYIRDLSGGRDPMRALAARFLTMGDELRMPTWAGPWHVHEAETHAVDGVVALQDADPFVVRALRSAGYPVLELTADNFNRESDDAAAIDAAITDFIEGEVSQRAEARRESLVGA